MSEATPRKFSFFPKTLGQCIEPLTRPVFKARGLAGSRLLTEWSSIVGPELARHAIPEKMSFPKGKKTDGTLTIAVENGFATELQYMQPVILERLSAYFGYQAVSRIVISHSYTAAPQEAPPAPRPKLPQDCARTTRDIEDPEIREALQSLAKTLTGTST